MRQLRSTLSWPVVLVAALALLLGGIGTAVAGPPIARVTKAQVKKIAGKVVTKKAPSLSVASAGHAGSADTLSALPAGRTMSGTFGLSGPVGGNALEGITFPRPLTLPAPLRIVDTYLSPDSAVCPGPGRAAAGVLCLYFLDHYGIDGAVAAVGDGFPFDVLGQSVGLVLTARPVQPSNRVYGSWTVGAP